MLSCILRVEILLLTEYPQKKALSPLNAQQLAIGAVGQQIQTAVGSLAQVPDAFVAYGEQALARSGKNARLQELARPVFTSVTVDGIDAVAGDT